MVQKNVRGRPRSFDEKEVLGKVLQTFWRHGFSATSMDQLAAATGLHKPSLYGAFGDKKQIYLKALDTYLDGVRAEFGEALARPRLMESLRDLADRSVALFIRDGGGCFMMSTAIPETTEDPEIADAVRAAMDSLDSALVRRFRRAIEEGEASAQADPEALARIFVANHYDLSARARAGYPVTELRGLADRTLALIATLAGVKSETIAA